MRDGKTWLICCWFLAAERLQDFLDQPTVEVNFSLPRLTPPPPTPLSSRSHFFLFQDSSVPPVPVTEQWIKFLFPFQCCCVIGFDFLIPCLGYLSVSLPCIPDTSSHDFTFKSSKHGKHGKVKRGEIHRWICYCDVFFVY